MNPALTQAVVAERNMDMQADAAAARRAREIRGSRRGRRAGRPGLLLRVASAWRAGKPEPQQRPLGDPGAA